MQPPLYVKILTHLVLGLASAIILLPLLWVLRTSFVDRVIAYKLPPDLFFVPTLDNYRTILTEMEFGKFFLNSMVVAATSTLLAVVIGAMAAYAIDRYKAGGPAMPMIILATQMMPPIVLVIPFFLIFKNIGLTDSRLGLVLAYLAFNLPYVVWLLLSFMKRVPRELDEAALIDGCTPLTAFIRIIVPAMLPGIGAATILSFVLCWNEFLFALMLTGQQTKTLPVAVSSLVTQQGTAIGAVSAATILAMLPMALLYFAVRRFLVAGLNAGAVKG
ncbi:MAG TPA: carbohydrate ABC transporter permease [Shinella sp.]|jgi:multiple sugar transport system permease protein|uniref:carbohydrate ABC transporter permease n=1 Tax=Shinella sp. TaxID=1870904 RepID=UPI0029A88BCA|nr:carbohydrate ABC transporter permease [Shinella sp.]MDX3974864.1 carbohydrate ABC transporter permease [Shinella sp.]HEV7247875.1 carbohydrate ABC transporter permease [Shinella sp.]